MTNNDRDREEAESEILREERQKPELLPYNENANGGRWWEDEE
jgi:hypothetical protein